MRRGERPLLQLPRPLLLGFAVLFLAQVSVHHFARDRIEAAYSPLRSPASASFYRQAAMGSERLLAHLLSIRLQLHDNQVGQHFSYSLIDYDVLVDWLDQITDIAPGNEYPMLLASRIYTQTADAERLRKMLGFIERRFADDPQLYWRRLAEASLIAKHSLGDLQLALSFAQQLAAQPDSVEMPAWARDFEFLLLAELNELESAIAIIQALLESGSVRDVDERRFLRTKLLEFQRELFESQQKPEN